MSEFVLDETEKVRPRILAASVPSVELVVLEGPARGQRAPVVGGRATVGSAESCTLRLADRSVSRIHFEIVLAAATISLRDLGSTNGTFVGDARVRDADVTIGTVIRCGGTSVRIDASAEPAVLPISDRTVLGELVGTSLAMRQVFAVIERVAPTAVTLLVQGETGTGKDVVARSVHALSPRAKGPFVPVDCGAVPEALFESELFGHVRGAFTGALHDRAGAIEEADGGTLFLDEIGELPLSLQAKLLRAIETRRIRRVGATRETNVDVRIVAATNRRLAQMVNEGTFREDLYYRLAVVEVALPPLRARREDIPMLAEHLYRKVVADERAELPSALLERVRGGAFPGNIRELRNVIERAVALGLPQGHAVTPTVLPAGVEAIVPLHLPLKEARDAWTSEFENIYIRAVVRKTNGNITRAAELAGVSRRFLQRTIARLGIPAADADD